MGRPPLITGHAWGSITIDGTLVGKDFMVAPDGAVPAMRIHPSMISSGTGSGENSRTERRVRMRVYNASVSRRCRSSGRRENSSGMKS